MNAVSAPAPVLMGRFWTWAMIIASVALLLVVAVELINIAFYDPYGDEYFLFRSTGILGDTDIAQLTIIMFGSLLVLLMPGLPLAFVTGGRAWSSSI